MPDILVLDRVFVQPLSFATYPSDEAEALLEPVAKIAMPSGDDRHLRPTPFKNQSRASFFNLQATPEVIEIVKPMFFWNWRSCIRRVSLYLYIQN